MTSEWHQNDVAKPVKSRARAELERAWAARFRVEGGGQLHPEGLALIRDLSRFCYGTVTTARMDGAARADGIAMAVAEGRRQALLFVLGRLGLAPLEALLSTSEGDTHDDRDRNPRRRIRIRAGSRRNAG